MKFFIENIERIDEGSVPKIRNTDKDQLGKSSSIHNISNESNEAVMRCEMS